MPNIKSALKGRGRRRGKRVMVPSGSYSPPQKMEIGYDDFKELVEFVCISCNGKTITGLSNFRQHCSEEHGLRSS